MKRKALFATLVVFFFGMVGYNLTVLFTPLFITPDPTFISAQIPLRVRTIFFGSILFLYPFGQFCSSPILGALSDRYGRRPLLVSSVGVMAVGYLLIAYALQIKSLVLLVGALFLTGLAAGNVVIAFSVVADLVKIKERGRFFGYVYLSRALGSFLGPLVGGKLTDPQLVSWFGIVVPFWGAFILLCFVFTWILFTFPETLKAEHQEKIDFLQAFINIKDVFTMKQLRWIFFMNFLVYLSIYGFFRSFPIYMVDEFHLSISKLSEYIAFRNLPMILVLLFIIGWITKRFTFRTLLMTGALCSGIFMLILMLPETPNEIWLPLFFAGASCAIALPATNALISSLVSQKEQGSILGNNQSLQVFGEALSALAAGLIGSILIKLSVITFGIVLIFSAILLIFLKPPLKQKLLQ